MSSVISSIARSSFTPRSIDSKFASPRIADSYTRKFSSLFGLPSVSNMELRLFPFRLRFGPELRRLLRIREVCLPVGD